MLKHKMQAGLAVILISATFTVMAGAVLSPVIQLIRSAFEVSSTLSGILITIHAGSIAAFSPLSGWLIDRIGTKKPYIIGLILYGLAGGMGYVVSSFPAILISRIVLGMGVALFFNAITVMILNLFTGPDRNRVMGLRASANSLGGIIWPLVGGALGSVTWQHPFLTYTLGLLLGISALFTVPDTKAEFNNPHVNKSRTLAPSVKQLFKRKPLLILIYANIFTTYLLLFGIVVFLPLLLSGADITRPFIISIFLSIISLAGVVSAPFYGIIKKILSYKTIVVITLTSQVICFLVLAMFNTPILWIIGLILFGASQGLIIPCLMVWTGDLVPGSLRGRMASYLGLTGFLGIFVAPLFFGPFIDSFGLRVIYFIASALAFFMILIYQFVLRKGSKEYI